MLDLALACPGAASAARGEFRGLRADLGDALVPATNVPLGLCTLILGAKMDANSFCEENPSAERNSDEKSSSLFTANRPAKALRSEPAIDLAHPNKFSVQCITTC